LPALVTLLTQMELPAPRPRRRVAPAPARANTDARDRAVPRRARARRGASEPGPQLLLQAGHASRDLHDPALAERRVIDIALTWGFSSAAHFSRAFRRKYGLSPIEFRRTRPAGPRSRAPGSDAAEG
jgi:AraC-like DNA-binding protein